MPDNDPVIIVSGLPRTGTSMMMRLLDAGGVPVLADELREADIDNPRGYYEFEPAKQLAKDASFLEGAGGKAVKMVYRLLYDLPATTSYRVVFMQRELSEVVASQNKMLERLGRDPSPIDDASVIAMFQRELSSAERWLAERVNFETLYVRYRDTLDNPTAIAAEVNRFLGGALDETAMAAVVEPSLYRNRT